jgi:hypothetical protein
MISHKIAEKYQGFLVYVSRTYKAMVPYLKGLHLTLDSSRPDRDEDGWRMVNSTDHRRNSASGRLKPPSYPVMVPRFKADMDALLGFFEQEAPPESR